MTVTFKKLTLTCSLILFAPFALAQHHDVTGATPSSILARQIEFMEAARQDATRDGAADALETGRRYLWLAESRLKRGEPWASDLHQEAALSFLRTGDSAEAIRTYERLESTAQTPMWRSYAAYRIGELSDGHEAIQALIRCRASILEHGVERDARLWIRATIRLADAQRSLGNLAEAIETRSVLWDAPWRERLDPEQAAIVCINNARDLFAQGEVGLGRAWFDALMEAHPGFGADDGRMVLFRLERVIAGRSLSEIRDDESLREIESIWNDPVIQDQPESMAVAANLATVHEVRRSDAEAARIAREARARFDLHERAWRSLDNLFRVETAIEAYTQVTISLAQRLVDDSEWAEAQTVLAGFVAKFPTSDSRALADQLLELSRRRGGPITSRRPTVADLDQDGDVDDADFVLFLTACGAASRVADLTGDGTIDARDVAAFGRQRD